VDHAEFAIPARANAAAIFCCCVISELRGLAEVVVSRMICGASLKYLALGVGVSGFVVRSSVFRNRRSRMSPYRHITIPMQKPMVQSTGSPPGETILRDEAETDMDEGRTPALHSS
jgi:hypothetical protein